MNATQIGHLGESYAKRHLKKSRYRIVDKNVHVSHDEIDIIARNKEYIVFVEVKTRTVEGNTFGMMFTPAAAVTIEKQQRTIRAARKYLSKSKYVRLQPRFDVIEVFLDKNTNKPISINHIENAFCA